MGGSAGGSTAYAHDGVQLGPGLCRTRSILILFPFFGVRLAAASLLSHDQFCFCSCASFRAAADFPACLFFLLSSQAYRATEQLVVLGTRAWFMDIRDYFLDCAGLEQAMSAPPPPLPEAATQTADIDPVSAVPVAASPEKGSSRRPSSKAMFQVASAFSAAKAATKGGASKMGSSLSAKGRGSRQATTATAAGALGEPSVDSEQGGGDGGGAGGGGGGGRSTGWEALLSARGVDVDSEGVQARVSHGGRKGCALIGPPIPVSAQTTLPSRNSKKRRQARETGGNRGAGEVGPVRGVFPQPQRVAPPE